MSSSTAVVARVGLDDKGFQEGIQKIQRSLKVVQSDFAAASSKLGDYGKSIEGLKLKSDSLNKQMEIQKSKVSALKKSYEESVATKGEDAKATENLRIKLNYAVADMNKMENELLEINKQIDIQSNSFTKLGKSLEGISSKMKKAGDGFTSAGSTLSKTVTAPIMAAGAGLFKLASDFDEATDTIRAGTGATGEALLNLEKDFKAVYQAVDTNISDASNVIADLNTRTGLSGQALQNLSTQMLKLSKITGEDLNTVIQTSTRMFADAGLSADEYSGALDYTFKVSQSTGIGIGKLQELMTKFGGPLRQMGFDWQTSAAMLGKFEKEGVNTELVVGSLRIALGKMAKEGIAEPNKALAEMISKIKEAGTAGEANALALEMFGSKAGPDMAAAIREGRLNLDELINSLKLSPETINQVYLDTRDAAEQFTILKNKIAVSLEPLGKTLFEAVNNAMPSIEKLIFSVTKIIEKFNELSPSTKEFILKFALVAAAIGPVTFAIGKVLSVGGTLIGTFSSIATAIGAAGGASSIFSTAIATITGPIGVVIALVTALIASFILLYKNNEDIRALINETWTQVQDTFSKVFEAIMLLISTFIEFSSGIWNKYKEELVSIISSAFEIIATVISTSLYVILNLIKLVTSLIKGDWSGVWEAIKGITSSILNAIKTIIENILNIIKNVVSIQFKFINDFISNIWNNLKSLTAKVWESIKSAIEKPVNAARDTVKKAVDAIYSFFKNLKIPEIKIPKIKLPHFSIKGSFNINPPSVPQMSVDWYAKGGIFNAPSIIGVGEAGPEAVIPIDKLRDLIGNVNKEATGYQIVNNISITAKIRDDSDIEKLAQRIIKEQNKYKRGMGYR